MNPRILIIDDEPEIRELYRNFLETENYEIEEAQNGQEAFRLSSEQHFDLYITDIMMPEMNGVEFMKVLKMIDPDAVVIIVTGFDDMEYTREALKYGAFRFLTKPINMKEFLSVVEMGLLERKQLFRASTTDKLTRLKDKLNSNPDLQEKVFQKLEKFLLFIEKEKATYIEMGGNGSKGKIWVKIKSQFIPLPVDRSFNQDEINIMILSILGKEEMDSLLEKKHLKFNHEFFHDSVLYRYRVKAFFELNELVVAIKPTRRNLFKLEHLRIPNQFIPNVSFKNENSGLVIFTGPSGSGKSSLIDTMVDYNNNTAKGSIYIIADSIEYYHESKNSIVRQQEIHSDVNSLIDALENCQDYNPDLVVIEDIKDSTTLEAALKLVDSGSMVFATLRNKSSLEALNKLINFYPANEQDQIRKHLAMNLNAIIAQHLVPTVKNTLVLAKETLINTSHVSNALVNNNIADIYALLLQGKDIGMQALEQDLFNWLKAGAITPEMAMETANNPKQLNEMIKYR